MRLDAAPCGAPNPRRVRIFFAEKQLAYETVTVSIAANEHQTPHYRAKNPLGLLPVLELADGRVLRESMAICRYVEELHPSPNLMGVDAWERAWIEQWNRHAELELLFPIADLRQALPCLPVIGGAIDITVIAVAGQFLASRAHLIAVNRHQHCTIRQRDHAAKRTAQLDVAHVDPRRLRPGLAAIL